VTLMDAPDVLTVSELAGLLRIGRNQAYQLVTERRIYSARIGRSIRVPKSAIVAYLEGPPTGNPELRRVV